MKKNNNQIYSLQAILNPNKKAFINADPSSVPGLNETLKGNISGLELYGLRGMVLSREMDTNFIPLEAKKILDSGWGKHLERNFLNNSEVIYVEGKGNISERLLNPKYSKLSKNGIIVPYYASDLEFKMAENLEGELFATKPEISDKYNNKVSLRKILEELNYKTPKGETFESETQTYKEFQKIINSLIKHSQNDAIFIRRGEGASGIGQYKISKNDSSNKIKKIFNEIKNKKGNYLIEEYLNIINCPSIITTFSSEEGLTPIASSKQLLEGTKHSGNEININTNEREKYFKYTKKLLEEMYENGYIGLGGIDLVETNHELYISEVNARGTAAFFPVGVLHRINEKYNHQNKITRLETIKIPEIKLNDFHEVLHYYNLEPVQNNGIGIININPGKFLFPENGIIETQNVFIGRNINDLEILKEKYINEFR